jgi:hypothetical protein
VVLEYAVSAGCETRMVASDWRSTLNICPQYFAAGINVDRGGGSKAWNVWCWAEALMEIQSSFDGFIVILRCQ